MATSCTQRQVVDYYMAAAEQRHETLIQLIANRSNETVGRPDAVALEKEAANLRRWAAFYCHQDPFESFTLPTDLPAAS